MVRVVLVCCLLISLPESMKASPALVNASAGSVTLANSASLLQMVWEPSPSAQVSGYFLYWGQVDQACTNHLDVGGSSTATIAGIEPGVTYRFYVVAYDAAGQESPPSNEISYSAPSQSVPEPGRLSLKSLDNMGQGSALSFEFNGVAGNTYRVQATEDFKNWETLLVTNCVSDSAITLTDIAARPHRFYRIAQ